MDPAGAPQSRCKPVMHSGNSNAYSATTQAGQGEGGTAERGDPRCDPSETGGCGWHSC